MALTFMYITNDPNVAMIAEKNGVQRIWIDLETIGKEERQRNMDTVKSHHTIEDIRKIAPILTVSEMMVRINPWNENSVQEINSVIRAGAEIIMLPMWKTVREVENFITIVDGRVKTMLLLETKEAAECLDDILKLQGIDEIHIGLNDLHLSYHLTFMFELLTNGVVESICKKISKKELPYGFGGIARMGHGVIPAEMIIMEHYRLGSTRAILSRSFCDCSKTENLRNADVIFQKNMKHLYDYEAAVAKFDKTVLTDNREKLKKAVDEEVRRLKGNSMER